jgi:hypothetical protein
VILVDRSTSIGRNAPKIGLTPAETRYQISINQLRFAGTLLFVVVLALIAATVRSGILDIVVYVFLIPPFVLLVNRLRLRHKYFRELTESLGIRINFRNNPPLTSAYEQWCEKLTSNHLCQ